MFDTPILLLIFNRPDLSQRIFERVKEIKPTRLFIAADGPREGRNGEGDLCAAARNGILQGVDWPCEVTTLFREKNLGCRVAVSSAITWFFDQVEEGIILEDDTLPNKSFFEFCHAMLNKYRSDKRVMHISGDCFLKLPLKESYYFTNYTHIWGWATWRRAWSLYDPGMKGWESKRNTPLLQSRLKHPRSEEYWKKTFDEVYNNEFDTWDHQWTYCCWSNGGLAIAPAVNMISNIGFRNDATHTSSPESSLANIPVQDIDISELVHPSDISINKKADHYVRDNIYVPKPISLFKRALNKLSKI
ncbi:MAG: hypothetical protein QM731_17885 [Chitinophagaceae bacterium]